MIRIGTCSWKYPSWEGIVYSSDAPGNFLEEYARHFNTVEIDQWFWSLFAGKAPVLPRTSVAEEYVASVGDDFRFTIKAPNSLTLTHYYSKSKTAPLEPNPHFLSPGLYDQFLESIAPILDKTGMIMLQFEYLNKQKLSGLPALLERLDSFLTSIDRTIPLGLEIRNPNFLNPHFFHYLSQNKVSVVFLEGYYMPPVIQAAKPAATLHSPVVIRLHGPDRSGIEERSVGNWNSIIEPKDAILTAIADMIAKLHAKETDIYLNVNNHFEGSAPLTIEKMRKLLPVTG